MVPDNKSVVAVPHVHRLGLLEAQVKCLLVLQTNQFRYCIIHKHIVVILSVQMKDLLNKGSSLEN